MLSGPAGTPRDFPVFSAGRPLGISGAAGTPATGTLPIIHGDRLERNGTPTAMLATRNPATNVPHQLSNVTNRNVARMRRKPFPPNAHRDETVEIAGD